MTDFWTAERVEQLQALYSDPHIEWSFSEIAAKLGGGISRNACIGKAHRLGLERRASGRRPLMAPVIAKPQSRNVGAVVQKINAAKAAPAPKIKPEPFVCAPVVDLEPLHLTLADLKDGMCRD